MKIAFFIDSLHSSAGTERMATIIANSMAQHHQVDMITIHGGEPFFALDGRIKLTHLVPEKRWSKVMRHYFGYMRQLRRVLRQGKYDYVVDVSTLLTSLSVVATLGLRTRVISWEHFNANVNWGRLAYRVGRFMASRFAHKVVVLTDADKALWRRKYRARNVMRITNPITIEVGAPSTLTQKRFLAIGRFVDQKGFDMLLDAWAQTTCRNHGWQLRIVGSGWQKERYEEQIARLGIEQSVELLPPTKDVVGLYGDASCFVLSSRFEGFVLVMLEATAMGLPAVSFDCETGPNELIVDGVTGRLVPPCDVAALAATMDEVAADPQKLAAMGAAALQRSRLYTVDIIAEQWLKLLEA